MHLVCWGAMRDHDEPPTEPAPWEPFGMPPVPRPPQPPRRDHDRYSYQDSTASFDDVSTEIRSAGLRRLSKLTWRTTQLSALAAVAFATLFGRSAPAHTVANASRLTPSTTASPSPTATKRKHHHHKKRATPTPTTGSAGRSGGSDSAGSSPTPTLAPPPTTPAPQSPSPSPSATCGGSKAC